MGQDPPFWAFSGVIEPLFLAIRIFFLSDFLEELKAYEDKGVEPGQGVVEEITAPDGTQWVVYINEHED